MGKAKWYATEVDYRKQKPLLDRYQAQFCAIEWFSALSGFLIFVLGEKLTALHPWLTCVITFDL